MLTEKKLIKAVKLTLKVWEYLHENPECQEKCEIPSSLYRKIENLDCECPLCEIFDEFASEDGYVRSDRICKKDGFKCPLYQCYDNGKNSRTAYYDLWDNDYNNDYGRKKYSGKIVMKLRKWLIKHEKKE